MSLIITQKFIDIFGKYHRLGQALFCSRRQAIKLVCSQSFARLAPCFLGADLVDWSQTDRALYSAFAIKDDPVFAIGGTETKTKTGKLAIPDRFAMLAANSARGMIGQPDRWILASAVRFWMLIRFRFNARFRGKQIAISTPRNERVARDTISFIFNKITL